MEPNWKPLIDKLGEERCGGFMFMGRVNGINLYKHGIARLFLDLDDDGNCYIYRGKSNFERVDFNVQLQKLETALAELGETLDSVYDEDYISRKKKALADAGIEYERFEIDDPGSFFIH